MAGSFERVDLNMLVRFWCIKQLQFRVGNGYKETQTKLKITQRKLKNKSAAKSAMRRKQASKVLRDTEAFRNLMLQGRLKYDVRLLHPGRLRYYARFVKSEGLHFDELKDTHFYVWDAVNYAKELRGRLYGVRVTKAAHVAYDLDSVPIALSWL